MEIRLVILGYKRVFNTPDNQKTAINASSRVMRWGDRLIVRAMTHATDLAPREKSGEVQTEIYVMF